LFDKREIMKNEAMTKIEFLRAIGERKHTEEKYVSLFEKQYLLLI